MLAFDSPTSLITAAVWFLLALFSFLTPQWRGIHVFTGFQLHLWPEGRALAQMDSLQELCSDFLHADKWAAVLLALWALSQLWTLEGDFDFSLLMVTCAMFPDLVIKFVPTLSLALKAGCGGCLAGAAPKRSPSTGAFDRNILRTEQAGVIPESSICCIKCKSLPEEVPFQLLTIVLLCNYSFGWKFPAF